MAPRVTSHDVARRAGVSRATVSTVLNQVQGVSISQATRQRVLLAAAELSYKPNSAARMLVRGNTETVGLVVTHPELLSVDGFVQAWNLTSFPRGFAYGIGLQAVEASVGVALGFIFLAREGFSFAMLRRMPEVTDLEVDERVERIA